MSRRGFFKNPILAAAVLAAASGAPFAQQQASAAPERFTGTLMVLNAPATGVMRLKVTVERWTTDDERKKMVEAVKTGGTDALVEVMDKMEAGYIQIENNLRWPVRSASSWSTDKGRLVRFATNRPINFLETWNNTRSRDYPIGVIELLLPPEGKGEGALLVATQVRFDENGRLEVKSLPTNTGAQKVTNVETEMIEPKKDKKK